MSKASLAGYTLQHPIGAGMFEMRYGVDVGGTKIELSIFDSEYRCAFTKRINTPTNDYQTFLSAIQRLVFDAESEWGIAASIGVGLPCLFESAGSALSASIPAINRKPVRTDLAQALGRPVVFENDVNAFVYSEASGGAGKGFSKVLGVVLGTGVGGGLCIDGNIYSSKQGVALEFGHVPMPTALLARYQMASRECGCGATGCYNEYLSGRGLSWMAAHFGSGNLAAETVIEQLDTEPAAQKAFAAYVDCLGAFLAQLMLLYDPDVIVLGGGMSKVKRLYDDCRQATAPHLMSGVQLAPVLPAVFGDASGVRGAAMLGAHQVELAR